MNTYKDPILEVHGGEESNYDVIVAFPSESHMIESSSRLFMGEMCAFQCIFQDDHINGETYGVWRVHGEGGSEKKSQAIQPGSIIVYQPLINMNP